MCSIPGLPMPRSATSVVIARVSLNPTCDLVQLWVSMQDGPKDSYEKMREEIQTPERKFSGREGKPEDLCLVCISDTWHRARIVSLQNETYSVSLIDQGLLHTTTSEALAWAQKEIFILPPEIEFCILTNVLSVGNSSSEKAKKFLSSLSGKKFTGRVEHVLMPSRIILLDIPDVSKHMHRLGVTEIVPAEEFKCLVLKSLHLLKEGTSDVICFTQEHNLDLNDQLDEHDQCFYPELLTGAYETVEVTEVSQELKIYCKLVTFSKAVKILSEQLHQHYEDSLYFEEQPPTCGSVYATRGPDGKWHRSLLKQSIESSDGLVEVFHVDEGKTELVPTKDIRALLGKFLRMPVVTYLCYLSGIEEKGRKWTADEQDYLKSLLVDKKVRARFDYRRMNENAYNVTLYTADVTCINSCFLQKIGILLPSNSRRDSSDQNENFVSLFVSSLKDRPVMRNVTVNDDALPVDTSTSQEGPEVSDKTEDESTSDLNLKVTSQNLDPVMDKAERLSTDSLPKWQNAGGSDVLTVGSSVGVKVSHIESLQNFWCQTTDNEDSLIRLTQELQKYYTSAHPQPLVDSIFIARNPDDNMWHRARIMADSLSPVVDVRFLDYGQTQRIPLQDICSIDPAFLRLNAQAHKCCLFTLTNPHQPCAFTHSDALLTEFRRFVDFGVSSETALSCVVKEVVLDKEGLPLHLVDIETVTDGASSFLAQKCAQSEALLQVPPLVSSHTYTFSRHNIEVGGTENVFVTSSETVSHFYCQLERNGHLHDKVMKDIAQLGQPLCVDQTLGLNSACLAKYTGKEWYRGQVVEMSPKLKVHFVDYGNTVIMNESDIRPFSPQASVALSTPVLAVPLGLAGIPAEVPHEVNQWFADHAIGEKFRISVVAIGENGKLIVDLYDGSLNINELVRKKMPQTRISACNNQIDQQHHDSSGTSTEPNKVTAKMTQQNKLHGQNTMCVSEKEQMTSKSISVCSNVSIYTYVRPNMDRNKVTEAYATCIVGPNYFWCQQTNAEDLLTMSKHAQMAEQAQEGVSLETLKPGSPCLALFSSDNQWYRAQVIQTTDLMLNVLFVDYGNESKVDIENVRPLPESLLKAAPQAFLCSLNGFDEPAGSWDETAHDDFYNLLDGKPLQVTVMDSGTNSELAVPQYAVKIKCDDTDINGLMQKHWRSSLKEHVNNAVDQTEISPQDTQTEGEITQTICNGNDTTRSSIFEKPKDTVTVYASCISEPHFFWCQYSNTEDLNKVSELAQELGQTQQDMTFVETLGPGSPCLALFSSDNRWYRAQVIQRVDDVFHVVFIDYGNEAEVEKKNVRALSQCLFDIPPQALLCCLSGFNRSEGSWTDEVYDGFYSVLIDKPLKITLLSERMHSENNIPQYSVEIDCDGVLVNAALQKYWKPATKKCVSKEKLPAEDLLQGSETESKTTQDGISKKIVSTGIYKEPKLPQNMKEMVYASCISEPHFFWCQHTNTEELNKVSELAQEAGDAQRNTKFPETLGAGSPCLALFSSDNRWYRAQVTQRVDDVFHIVFIDYGNELEVDQNGVKPVPPSLLEIAPLAFLCSLNGFEKSKGSWADEAYDDFYNILVDKPLRLTKVILEHHSEASVPQYSVDIECEGVAVNSLMSKYWKELDKEESSVENLNSEDHNKAGTME